MTIAVIGAGFGRTGTLSLKWALERLGLGPCHHMSEILVNPGQLPLWQAAARGEEVDWDQALKGYRSTMDWPSAFFWRELTQAYPQAKVILSTRDPEAWYASFSRTALELAGAKDDIADPHMRATLAMGEYLVGSRVFDGRADDPEHALTIFKAHEAAVRDAIPANRLLVFDVRQGWSPLCDFLGLAVPEEPFPRINNVSEFMTRFGR